MDTSVTETNFAEFSRKYEDLQADFERLKKRAELEYAWSERAGYARLCLQILLPLYDEILRAWKNTGSQDLMYYMKEIKSGLDKNDFVIMDHEFLDTLHAYIGADKFIDYVDVVQSFETSGMARIKDVFNVGLLDRFDNNKIVKYPKVTLYTYRK